MKANIYVLDTEKLCHIYSTLNSWKWPDELGSKPDGWNKLPFFDKEHNVISKSSIISPINSIIMGIVGEKELLRYHQMYNLNKTDNEFEIWWNKHHCDEVQN